MEKIKELCQKHKEIVNYLIFGAAATFLNWIVYSVLVKGFSVNENVSNVIAWAFAVAFAFVTNKWWVFESKNRDKQVILKEGLSFLGSRLATGVVEIGLFPILKAVGLDQSFLGVDGFVAKIVVTIIVIILNYIFSKFIVFRKERLSEEED